MQVNFIIHLSTSSNFLFNFSLQEEIASSDIHVKAGAIATRSAFDMDEVPTKYIGVKSPTQDPKEVAKEMFGLCPSGSETPNAFYSPINYGGPFIPFYAPPNQFGLPYDGSFDYQVTNNSSSNSSEASPVGSMATTLFPHYQQYAMPMPFPYILGGQYSQMYNCSPSATTDAQNKDGTAQKLMTPPSPLAVKILSSSGPVEKAYGAESESQDVCRRKNLKTKHYSSGNFSYNCPDVAGLSSPLKRMKVADGISMDKSLADDSVSAYFADVSANSTCSDDEAEDNEEVSSIMSLLQGRQNREMGFTGLNQISFKEKESLEKITGTSDLSLLLSNGLESLTAKEGKIAQMPCTGVQSPPPPTTCAETKYVFSANGDCVSVTAMDMHDIDAKVTSSQEDNYYLPSLDSLLNIGEDTIVTMKAAMNLDIQGVVEIATEDSCKDLQSQEAHSCTNGDTIHLN